MSYPFNKLYEEVANLAFYFHWSRDNILDLEHYERQQWLTEINKISKKNEG